MKEPLLLVFANKQDIQGGTFPPYVNCGGDADGVLAMKPQEVTDALKLSQLKDKIWYVVPSCATTGEGLLEGLVCLIPRLSAIKHILTTATQAWLSNNVKSPPNAPKK